MVVGGSVVYVLTRAPDQALVGANALPVAPATHRLVTYVDCSKVGAAAYDPNNPCQTFVLLRNAEIRSASALLTAEATKLRAGGWRQASTPIPVDRDGGAESASVSESWVAPRRDACAFVTTVKRAVADEGKELFPYDPYNQPRGVLGFYRQAKAASGTAALWVRLEPALGGC